MAERQEQSIDPRIWADAVSALMQDWALVDALVPPLAVPPAPPTRRGKLFWLWLTDA